MSMLGYSGQGLVSTSGRIVSPSTALRVFWSCKMDIKYLNFLGRSWSFHLIHEAMI